VVNSTPRPSYPRRRGDQVSIAQEIGTLWLIIKTIRRFFILSSPRSRMVKLIRHRVFFLRSTGPYNHNLFSLCVAIINVINSRTLNGLLIFTSVVGHSIIHLSTLDNGSTNPWRRVPCVTKFCIVAPSSKNNQHMH
jgi:hypothetical protein